MLNKDTLSLEFWVGTEEIAKHSIKIGHGVEYDSETNTVAIKCHDGCYKYSLQKIKKALPLHLIPNNHRKSQHLYPAKIIKIEDKMNVTIKKDGGYSSYSVNKVIIHLDTEPIMNDDDDFKNEDELPHRFFVYGTLRDDDESEKKWTARFASLGKASNAKLYGYKMYQNKSADDPFAFAVRTDNNNDCIAGRILTFDNTNLFNTKLFDADQFYGYKRNPHHPEKALVNRTIVNVDIDHDNSKLEAIIYHQDDDCKIQEVHVEKALVLLICIPSYDKPYDNLKGTVIDKTNMIKLWVNQYDYDVIPNPKDRVEEDDYNELLNQCRNELSQKKNKHKYGALIVIFSGHGNEKSLILSDGKKMSRSKLCKYFNGENVPFMSDKPKIIIMDACRGLSLPNPVPNDNKKPKVIKVSKGDSDDEHNPDEQIILLYSTTKGYAIPDDDEYGGNVIRTIYEVFSYVDNKHLDDLFKIVQKKVKKLCSAYQCIEHINLGCDSHIFLEENQQNK
eukprot:172404_1